MKIHNSRAGKSIQNSRPRPKPQLFKALESEAWLFSKMYQKRQLNHRPRLRPKSCLCYRKALQKLVRENLKALSVLRLRRKRRCAESTEVLDWETGMRAVNYKTILRCNLEISMCYLATWERQEIYSRQTKRRSRQAREVKWVLLSGHNRLWALGLQSTEPLPMI